MQFIVFSIVFVCLFQSVYSRSRHLKEFELPSSDEIFGEDDIAEMTQYGRHCGRNLVSALTRVCKTLPYIALFVDELPLNRKEESITLMCCIRKCAMLEMSKFCGIKQNDDDNDFVTYVLDDLSA